MTQITHDTASTTRRVLHVHTRHHHRRQRRARARTEFVHISFLRRRRRRATSLGFSAGPDLFPSAFPSLFAPHSLPRRRRRRRRRPCCLQCLTTNSGHRRPWPPLPRRRRRPVPPSSSFSPWLFPPAVRHRHCPPPIKLPFSIQEPRPLLLTLTLGQAVTFTQGILQSASFTISVICFSHSSLSLGFYRFSASFLSGET